MTQTHEEWLAWRRSGIGASDVAAIAGLSPWATPMSVWVSKIDELPDEQSESMEWGHLLEPVIARKFAEVTELVVGHEQAWCAHPDSPHHLATVDGFVFPPGTTDPDVVDALGVLEIKTTGDFPWDQLPDTYAIQVQWQLHVTGKDEAWVAVLHMARGRAFRVYEVSRDQSVIDTLVRIVDRFWSDFVVAKEPPPVDGLEATTKAIRAHWPTQDPETVVHVDPELWREYHHTKAAAKLAAEAHEAAKQNVQVLMGDAEVALMDGQKAFSWKASGRGRRFLDHKVKETADV